MYKATRLVIMLGLLEEVTIFMLKNIIIISLLALTTSGCSSWIYKINIPQGNFLDEKSINKLQLGMTKEQVKFVLGTPILIDTFEKNTWYYLYDFKSGKDEKLNIRKEFKVVFTDDKLSHAEGDFELPESYYTPIEN